MALDLANEILIRWTDADPKHASLLQEGGVTVAWGVDAPAFRDACAAAGIRALPAAAIQSCALEELRGVAPGTPVAVKWGLWPGVQGRDPDVASATRTLWMDTNGFRVGCLRALYPAIPPLLAYQPDADAGVKPERVVPFESLELALVEAWVAGGNYVLALEPRYQEALLRGDAKAMEAWRSLGRTARWLREHAEVFRQPPLPTVTMLVDHGDFSHEIAKLMYRQSVSPSLHPLSDPPPPDPARRVVIAAGVDAPPAPIADRLLAHASAGAILVVDGAADDAWWRRGGQQRARSQEDRDFYTFGRGEVVAYRELVDPGEFALDVVDLVTQARRPARLWNCQAGVPLATAGPRSGPVRGQAALHVLNYSRSLDLPVLARIEGVYDAATVLRPDHAPLDVKVARRGSASEVAIPEIARIAVVVFK